MFWSFANDVEKKANITKATVNIGGKRNLMKPINLLSRYWINKSRFNGISTWWIHEHFRKFVWKQNRNIQIWEEKRQINKNNKKKKNKIEIDWAIWKRQNTNANRLLSNVYLFFIQVFQWTIWQTNFFFQ